MKGFIAFIREQGVIGLAIGFILGGAVSKLVAALVTDIINPVLSVLLGSVNGLKEAKISFGNVHILYGDFINVLVDFIIVALVVYVGVKILNVQKGDKEKE